MSILKLMMTFAVAIGAFVSGSSREFVQFGKNAPVRAEHPPGSDDGASAGGC